MSPLQPEPEEKFVILSCQFDDAMVAITYMEHRDVGEGAAVQRTLMIDPDQVEDELEIVEDAIRDLVDQGLLVLRKPASKLSRTAQMLRESE